MKRSSTGDQFFLYAAPIYEVDGKFVCLIFGLLGSNIIAYGGHYLVEKERLYSPGYKTPVDEVHFTEEPEC